MSIVSRKSEIRRQIYFKGSKNEMSEYSDRIAFRWEGIPRSHVAFVKTKHTKVKYYKEACEDVRAATLTLSMIKSYNDESNDELFHEYYRHFKMVVATGDQYYIDCCKEILQFVKYPEGSKLPYTIYTYDQLVGLSYYSTVKDYPKDYIMKYDVINEFDLRIKPEQYAELTQQYKEEHLSIVPYTDGPSILGEVKSAIKEMAKCIPTSTKKLVRNIIVKGPQYRLGRINNTRCALGDKRIDFFYKLKDGIDPSIAHYVQRDIDRLNRLYHLNIDMPPIIEGGISDLYFSRLIVQEDPKKWRPAYQSNPIEDYIGYPGMDMLHAIFQDLPFIQCGRKRDVATDMLLDKHRYNEIAKVYRHNKASGRSVTSTDLSKATEHLNALTSIELVKQFLYELRILDKDTVDKWTEDTFSQLHDVPLTVVAQQGLYYPKCGQTQGVPGSFHLMTFTLAVINLQSCLNAGISAVNAMKSIQNNGDDGTTPTIAIPEYKRILELMTGPGVFNQEKSFDSSINESLEFCKTIYYHENPELITGYRYSTLYKLTRDARCTQHAINAGFEHERELFTWFLSDIMLNIAMDDEQKMAQLAYGCLTDDKIINKVKEVTLIWDIVACSRLTEVGNSKYHPIFYKTLPESWYNIIPQLAEYKIEGDKTLISSDIAKLSQYYDQEILEYSYNDVLLSTDSEYNAWKDEISFDYDIDFNLIGRRTLDNGDIIIVLPVTEVTANKLEISKDSKILIAPRTGTKLDKHSIEHLALRTVASETNDPVVKITRINVLDSLYKESEIYTGQSKTDQLANIAKADVHSF